MQKTKKEFNFDIVNVTDKITNAFGEYFCRSYGGGLLDDNKILWKVIDGEWIGKRSVWTYDFKSCWLEETKEENIKSWWCGKDSDYNEIFKR